MNDTKCKHPQGNIPPVSNVWDNSFCQWRKACNNMSTRQSVLDALDFQVNLEDGINRLADELKEVPCEDTSF